jgi:two-component system, NtrC family, response regulator
VSKPTLLVVDDDDDVRTQMKWALAEDYEVLLAGDRPQALALVASDHPAVVTLDLGLPPRPQEAQEGLAALAEILQRDAATKVIVITGREEREHALAAVADGAYDYLAKPVDVADLKVILRRAFHLHRLEAENRDLQSRVGDSFEGMLGTSAPIQTVFTAIRKVAMSADAGILILGESGVGKELVARAIHRLGPRGTGPFVAINCGAIPENLLESELFGHEKGSFTGAHAQRKGRIESASGGTLFLDEVGELPPLLQVKLLRFLQDRQVERVGGRQPIEVDARVMAATNIDLKQAMQDARFREDLYFRLAVVTITVPPLRDRREDLPLLSKALLQRYAAESGKKVSGFTPHALRAIEVYDWPGNVRELENRVRRAVVMAEGHRLTEDDLELATTPERQAGRSLRDMRDALEKDVVQRTLARNRGNITQTAAELGVSRPTLYELMGRLGISKEG